MITNYQCNSTKAYIENFQHNSTFELKCTGCNKSFFRLKKQVLDSVKKGFKDPFCSKKCLNLNNPRKNLKKNFNLCKNCEIEFQPKKITSSFCSKVCVKKYKSRLGLYTKSESILDNQTKEDLFNSRSNYQSARSSIQKHARKVYKLNKKPECCLICGYTRHFEVCHIKSVSDFAGYCTIKEINSQNNLVALCPTHHWEFDNGFLKL